MVSHEPRKYKRFPPHVMLLFHRTLWGRCEKDRFPWEQMPRRAADWLPQAGGILIEQGKTAQSRRRIRRRGQAPFERQSWSRACQGRERVEGEGELCDAIHLD